MAARPLCRHLRQGAQRRTVIRMTTVLVVEDETLVRLDLADRLADAGYIVVEAANAAEAIRILEKNRDIRCVFSDINMPGKMDGLQLLHVIRERWPPTLLVVCSANEKPRDELLPTGALYINKPYEDPALAEVVTSLAAQLSA